MDTSLPSDVLSAMTRRDLAAYREQSLLAVALRREARGADGADHRRQSEAAGLERVQAAEEAQRLFAQWLAHVELPHPL